MAKFNTLSDTQLNALPGSLQVRLYTTAPTRTSAGTELSAGGYSPQSVTLGSPAAGTTGRRRTATAGATWSASANWTAVVASAITDTSGNVLHFMSAATTPAFNAQTVSAGGTLTIAAADIYAEEF